MEPIIISEKDFQHARNKIREAKKQGKEVIFTSSNDDLNRKVLEKEPIDVLLLMVSGRKDRMKQRESGFNQVLAKTAKKKNIIIGINLDEILNAEKKEKAEILARIRQNLKLCSKNKLKMVFISKNSKKENHDIKALGIILGMPTWMTKKL